VPETTEASATAAHSSIGTKGAGPRSARAPREPRLLVGGERDAVDDVTPWDIHIYADDVGDRHHEITASPAVSRDTTAGHQLDDINAGYQHFTWVAGHVAANIRSAADHLVDTHGCRNNIGSRCGLSSSEYLEDTDDPGIWVGVPDELADAWLDRFTTAFTTALKKAAAA
jgi:hypothetical protein